MGYISYQTLMANIAPYPNASNATAPYVSCAQTYANVISAFSYRIVPSYFFLDEFLPFLISPLRLLVVVTHGYTYLVATFQFFSLATTSA